MNYHREAFADCVEEIKSLTVEHYGEVAPYKDIPLDPDWDRYILLDKMGYLRFFTAREEGVLLGYAIYSVGFSIDYSSSYQASLMNIFITKESRGNGGKFILFAEEYLKENDNVQVIDHHVKAFNDYGPFLEKLGYQKMNINYSKRLDKE
jgi:hypothetical protein